MGRKPRPNRFRYDDSMFQSPKQAQTLLSRAYKKFRRAERELSLPLRGERILLGLSGGWDSCALLILLERYRKVVEKKPELFAAYTAFQAGKAVPPSPAFLRFVKERGVPLLTVTPKEFPPSCPLCRLKRRELLLKAANALSCKVVALGHNLEDFGETLLMNLLYCGTFEGLFPKLNYFGRLKVVRPLTYLRKHEINALGKAFSFPPSHPECPLYSTSKRMAVRAFLAEASEDNKHVLNNLLKAALKNMDIEGASPRKSGN